MLRFGPIRGTTKWHKRRVSLTRSGVPAHGIMFHHFHGPRHPRSQGSISASDFREILTWLRNEYVVLGATDFHEAAVLGDLPVNAICLTFDDSLLCQYEIAAPILAEEGLTAFYFVYSSVFTDDPNPLEIYRYFRSTVFVDFATFCDEFMLVTEALYGEALRLGVRDFETSTYLQEFTFYSRADRLFRYVRDIVLTPEQYAEVMRLQMETHNFDISEVLPLLFMDSSHLVDLRDTGNRIGLHSHTHPTDMDKLGLTAQQVEYATNRDFLSRVLGEVPTSMSHPCGRYNDETLTLLHQMGVQIGFRSSMTTPNVPSLLELPREDHTNILRRVRS